MDLRADFGPTALSIAVRRAAIGCSAIGCTSDPYSALGNTLVLTTVVLLRLLVGTLASLLAVVVASLILLVSVPLWRHLVVERCAPRSLTLLLTLTVLRTGCH